MIKHLKQVQGHWKPRVVTVPTLPPRVPPEVVTWQPAAPMTTTPAHRGVCVRTCSTHINGHTYTYTSISTELAASFARRVSVGTIHLSTLFFYITCTDIPTWPENALLFDLCHCNLFRSIGNSISKWGITRRAFTIGTCALIHSWKKACIRFHW